MPFDDATGGHGTYVRAHALAARAAGFAPQVFLASSRSRRYTAAVATMHEVPAPFPRHYRAAVLHRAALARAVTRYIAELDHDCPVVIHSFGPWAGAGVSASRALERRGIESVAIASAYSLLSYEARAKVRALRRHHSPRDQLHYRLRELWTQTFLSRAELRGYLGSRIVLANYESVCNLLREACDRDLPLRMLPYASPSAFERRDRNPAPPPAALAALRPREAPLIVCVARQDPRKGQDVLLDALAGVKRRGIDFRACFVGTGHTLPTNRGRVAALGLDQHVAFLGHVDDVFDYLENADVFALPSLVEGSGSVAVLEALQAGIAIIASRCDGIPEDLVDGESGLLVEPGSVSSLEDGLCELLADGALRQRLATQARRTFETRFSADSLTAALADVYATAVRAPS